MINLLLLFIVAILLAGVIIALSTCRDKKNTQTAYLSAKKTSNRTTMQHCLLCGKEMDGKEKMISRELKRADDSIIYMYGCAHCAHSTTIKRRCPVCKRIITAEEYLVGRMWFRDKTGKNHLHIAGCSRCARIQRDIHA